MKWQHSLRAKPFLMKQLKEKFGFLHKSYHRVHYDHIQRKIAILWRTAPSELEFILNNKRVQSECMWAAASVVSAAAVKVSLVHFCKTSSVVRVQHPTASSWNWLQTDPVWQSSAAALNVKSVCESKCVCVWLKERERATVLYFLACVFPSFRPSLKTIWKNARLFSAVCYKVT